ncbi:methylaspartate ammonia-lyase [Proteiniclasticum ruminis]|uniref:methylaspartate ammonia-lyase n=1 Tax=Proteiniclasticum ruminis TaxID=398199 RepID=A0A1I5D504_9CLOT|nr:methylaspartate ammonia-lyase [Proteiniclasticum ruminis]SFN94243.1 methylaspartate ammonia-lyase [Proteiniclasticum ruminis]
MKIIDVVCSEGRTGFYFDDQKAIVNGAGHDGFMYVGEPETEGFTSIRVPGESISVMLILENGEIAHGDCAAVQYSGAGGRDPLFIAKDFIPVIEDIAKKHLIGKDASSFKPLADEIDSLSHEGKRLHTAIRYGMTQALLDAAAKCNRVTMAEIVQKEYETGVTLSRVPIFAQSGDDRYNNVDKMIIKGTDVMPHALINNVKEKLGENGEILLNYITWMRNRVLQYKMTEDYTPIFHVDVYGTIGRIFNQDLEKMAEYLKTLEEAAKPFLLRIEGPMDVGERTKQMEALRDLTKILDDRNINVELVADEWCNTYDDVVYFADNKAGHMIQVKTPDLGGVNNSIEAILYCKEKGIGAYLGGTCNETNRSAEVCTNIGMACGAKQVLAKPGMGVDEGFMIVNNEMNRVLALAKRRQNQ